MLLDRPLPSVFDAGQIFAHWLNVAKMDRYLRENNEMMLDKE